VRNTPDKFLGNFLSFFAFQYIINKFGRKLSLAGSLLICGVTCISGGFVPEKVFWIQIVLFLVGKMAITSAFTIVYVYSGRFRHESR
jgi:MFS family permease